MGRGEPVIRPGERTWRRWALNVATVLLGAVLNVAGTASDALRTANEVGKPEHPPCRDPRPDR
jgi:hypothetical protein